MSLQDKTKRVFTTPFDKQQLQITSGGVLPRVKTPPDRTELFDLSQSNNVFGTNFNSTSLDNSWLSTSTFLSPDNTVVTATTQAAAYTYTLQCPHPSCNSKASFNRQCDLDKHYRLHFRKYSCRVPGCHQVDRPTPLKFATAKDRGRHERLHNPSIICRHCGRRFSRFDNLREHCRRRHMDTVPSKEEGSSGILDTVEV